MPAPEHTLPRTAAAWLAAVALTLALPSVAAPPAGAEPAPYAWPVEGPVLRAFEAPPSPYQAGHRGIDIGAPLGTPVRASAGGVVAFAGSVAGSRFVSIDHPDGIRTTYSWLSSIGVRRGQQVTSGEVVAASGHGHPEESRPHLHFGARIGEEYLDPLALLGAASPRVHLAPLHEPARRHAPARGAGTASGLPEASPEVAEGWLWSRTEPKPLVLPGRAPGGPPP